MSTIRFQDILCRDHEHAVVYAVRQNYKPQGHPWEWCCLDHELRLQVICHAIVRCGTQHQCSVQTRKGHASIAKRQTGETEARPRQSLGLWLRAMVSSSACMCVSAPASTAPLASPGPITGKEIIWHLLQEGLCALGHCSGQGTLCCDAPCSKVAQAPVSCATCHAIVTFSHQPSR